MALVTNQALVSVTVSGFDLARAARELEGELRAYPQARIISLTQQSNFFAGLFGKSTLLAAVEYTAGSAGE